MTSVWPFRYFVAECMTMSCAELYRPVRSVGGLGRVDGNHGTRRAGDLAGRGDIGDVPGRIRRSLDPDDARRCDAAFAARSSGRRSRTARPASPSARRSRGATSAGPVHVARREHAVARRERLETMRRAAAWPDEKIIALRCALERLHERLGCRRR
jgi:hypothetical protein